MWSLEGVQYDMPSLLKAALTLITSLCKFSLYGLKGGRSERGLLEANSFSIISSVVLQVLQIRGGVLTTAIYAFWGSHCGVWKPTELFAQFGVIYNDKYFLDWRFAKPLTILPSTFSRA